MLLNAQEKGDKTHFLVSRKEVPKKKQNPKNKEKGLI